MKYKVASPVKYNIKCPKCGRILIGQRLKLRAWCPTCRLYFYTYSIDEVCNGSKTFRIKKVKVTLRFYLENNDVVIKNIWIKKRKKFGINT